MKITRRRSAISFFLVLGICLVAAAVTLNIGWIVVNARRHPALLIIGIILFILMIAGMIINTIFLVREIRRSERQDSFLNAFTHELKTPIASIRLYLETLMQRPVDEEQRQKFYRMMLEDNDRLLATVEQILRAGEAGQRKASAVRLPLDMRALTQTCVEETRRRHHLAEETVHIVDNTNGASLIIEGNTEDLRSALLNILDNAVKYSTSGHIEITVRLELLTANRLTISVSDKGIGILPANLKRVFNRFYRVTGHDTANVKGTGLGLFIVRTIARQHGGDARAHSFGAGKGTTITLELPLAGVHHMEKS